MLDIFPTLTNINPLEKILSNANINVNNFHHDILEFNIRKYDK